MNKHLQEFTRLLSKRITLPLKNVWCFIEKQLPKKVKEQLSFANLQTGLVFVLIVMLFSGFFCPRPELKKLLINTGRWPMIPSMHAKTGVGLFEDGKQTQAEKELQLINNSLFMQRFIKVLPGQKKLVNKSSQLIKQPEKIKNQIAVYNKVLKDKPTYLEVLLAQTLNFYQLKQDRNAEQTWNRAFYLAPNNSLVVSIGELLE
jgi:hypothetical protein